MIMVHEEEYLRVPSTALTNTVTICGFRRSHARLDGGILRKAADGQISSKRARENVWPSGSTPALKKYESPS